MAYIHYTAEVPEDLASDVELAAAVEADDTVVGVLVASRVIMMVHGVPESDIPAVTAHLDQIDAEAIAAARAEMN